MARVCDFTVPSADLVLFPLSAGQMPTQLATSEKLGCLKRDSGASEHTAFQAGAQDLALASAKCEFKLDLEFLKGILGVDKVTGYFCVVLTQEHLSVHSKRQCI